MIVGPLSCHIPVVAIPHMKYMDVSYKCYMIAHAQLHASLLECLVLLLTIHDRGLVAAAAQERVLSGNLFIMLVLRTVIYDSTSPPWLARPISLSLSLSFAGLYLGRNGVSRPLEPMAYPPCRDFLEEPEGALKNMKFGGAVGWSPRCTASGFYDSFKKNFHDQGI